MKLYKNFLGIDIGKFQFVTAVHGEKNTAAGVIQKNACQACGVRG
jgi:hypothetical protein